MSLMLSALTSLCFVTEFLKLRMPVLAQLY